MSAAEANAVKASKASKASKATPQANKATSDVVADEKDGNDTDFIVEKTRQVLDTIQSMKESYRMILNLSLIEGYDSEEIVQLLGISPENCRTLLSRAKASLRKKIEKYDTNSLK
jgi:RNA polymerase sigma factor (sigma-70 family)